MPQLWLHVGLLLLLKEHLGQQLLRNHLTVNRLKHMMIQFHQQMALYSEYNFFV